VTLLPIKALDAVGKPAEIAVEARPTVLLVLSPSFSHCRANWPDWQQLIRAAHASAHFGFIDISSTVDEAYITDHAIGSYTY